MVMFRFSVTTSEAQPSYRKQQKLNHSKQSSSQSPNEGTLDEDSVSQYSFQSSSAAGISVHRFVTSVLVCITAVKANIELA